jgi:hypothetical protein
VLAGHVKLPLTLYQRAIEAGNARPLIDLAHLPPHQHQKLPLSRTRLGMDGPESTPERAFRSIHGGFYEETGGARL